MNQTQFGAQKHYQTQHLTERAQMSPSDTQQTDQKISLMESPPQITENSDEKGIKDFNR